MSNMSPGYGRSTVGSIAIVTKAEALFVLDGDRYIPTDLTRTGWVDDAQHGGPPVGLLAHLLEMAPIDYPARLVRMTIDLMRSVPMSPLSTEVNVVREGRRIQVLDASLVADGVVVARATGLRIRTTKLDLPQLPKEPPYAIPPPEELPVMKRVRWETGDPDLRRFHHHALEVRSIGNSFWSPGRGLSWLRLKVPLIAGVATTPLTRVAALSDMGNGNARLLDQNEWGYINPDVTISLHRYPDGEWVGMDSVAHQHSDGIGQADTRLFDRHGTIGRVVQAQIIEAR